MIKKTIFLSFLLAVSFRLAYAKQIPLKIEDNKVGAPITIGIPFPKGELHSIDNVRLLDSKGKEILCQTTEVTTWDSEDESIKWIWVFFFTEKTSDYVLEYGEGVFAMQPKERIISADNMRAWGGISVNTGPLSFKINSRGSGFLDEVYLDLDEDKLFSADELIASSIDDKRGTFLDILDDSGIDMSKAVINGVFREKGSGPLHVIFRVEGTYSYEKKDNIPSPFTLQVHAYAGKSFIKVMHTLTYTGFPDKHKIQEGEHYNIATQNKVILSEETADDPGWTQPNDQISGCGLTFKYHLGEDLGVTTSIFDEKWYETGEKERFVDIPQPLKNKVSVLQTGPKQNNPEGVSTPTERLDGFSAKIFNSKSTFAEEEKAKGWIDISDGNRGIAIGIKNFFQEYPKELQVDPKTGTVTGYIWPADSDPMSFERKNTQKDGGMLSNPVQGITKTTEFIYYFHSKVDRKEINNTIDYVVKSPIGHAPPKWYTDTKVYGNMAPYSSKNPEFENALQYKYDWWAFNQNWESWYSMFDYGDGKTYYRNNKWVMWTNNEPTTDFMFWTNFMRTGDPKYYRLAENMSKHTMDVDNIHWPKKRNYTGEINDAIDYWNYLDEPESTPYLGIGRRHGNEHWHALLSAHVWIQGWISAYYITGNQRALDVAKMTGDTYINRIWGEHDLRGRRLYLSILNLVELYDATKLDKYKIELDDRVRILLDLQKEQGGNLLLDRYGYSQNYVAQGLYKYYQITGKKEIKKALVEHARWVRDVPPYNHQMESYLATIYPLLLGYEFTGNTSFLDEAVKRSEVLKVDNMSTKSNDFSTQLEYSEALLEVSNLPKGKGRPAIWGITNGLRVFGWTHAYNIPYLLYWLENPAPKLEE